MTASREFQEHLQAGQITEAIALVISQLVELDVTTELAATETHPPSSLSTKISLLTGQITTAIHPDLLSRESSQQILNFHTAQITATNEVVRDHLHSLRNLLQILGGAAVPIATKVGINSVPDPIIPIPVQVVDRIPDEPNIADFPIDISNDLSIVSELPLPLPPAEMAEPSAPISASIDPPPVSVVDVDKAEISSIADEFQHIENLLRNSDRPKTENGSRAWAGMAAAVAQAGSPKLDEANTIPNKFDQVLKSAGVKEKEDAANNPFISGALAADEPENDQHSSINNSDDIGLNPEWNEWLLEEDAILAELSQVSEEVIKDKIPEWDEQWLTRSDEQPVTTEEDWESFIPEYVDFDAPVQQGQANVQRFRQNLVNDPQLMSELLAELDDIERLNKDEQSRLSGND
jgi:hypothetical protein